MLVEGPPDAEAALPLLNERNDAATGRAADLRARRATARRLLPVHHFSPEWQALRYAFGRDIPARFMDLPQAIQLAREKEAAEKAQREQVTPLDKMPSERKATRASEVVSSDCRGKNRTCTRYRKRTGD